MLADLWDFVLLVLLPLLAFAAGMARLYSDGSLPQFESYPKSLLALVITILGACARLPASAARPLKLCGVGCVQTEACT